MAFKHARNCGKCGRYINSCWCSFYPEKGYHDEGLCDECFEADTREMWAKPPAQEDRPWRPTYTSPVSAIVPTDLTETERNELMRLRVMCDQLTDLMTGWKHRAERAENDLGEARSYANNLLAQQDSTAAERRRVEISLIQARETIRCEAKMRQAAEDQAAELAEKYLELLKETGNPDA